MGGWELSGFLDEMAAASARRVAEAIRRESPAALAKRARAAPAAPELRLSAAGFDVIAEIKLRSPAAGVLGQSGDDWLGRATAYAGAGAAAVSVLTEPDRFDGSLDHLREAAAVLAPLGVPVMRKDFLVAPYQVLEARACGAGGVLVIVRMLPRDILAQLLDTAATLGMFVLLEAFDAQDLAVAAQLLAGRGTRHDAARVAARDAGRPTILIGVNCRDLQTLGVNLSRFAELAGHLPKGWPAVAESGVADPAGASAVARLGYRAALVGTALMTSGVPATLIAEILRSSRTAAP
jgi:indole-3-glycerol phosphate synthase